MSLKRLERLRPGGQMLQMSFMHDYMDVGGRAKQDARAEEQLMTLPQKR